VSEFNIKLNLKLDDGQNWTTPDLWDWHALLDLGPDESAEVRELEVVEAHP
jgi:hypothetical protein